MLPKISVITPSLNSGPYIEQTIQSVLAQRYPNFEHVVMDGGSQDGTLEILKKYPHLVWISKPDRGQSDAMNQGFEISTGDIIVYLNADDYFELDAFSHVSRYLGPGISVLVGQVKVVRDDGSYYINNPKVQFGEMLKWWEPDAYCYNSSGCFYARKVFQTVGGFNINSHHTMDLEFMLEASRHYRFTKIDSILGVFRFIRGTKTFNTQGGEYYKEKFDFCDQYLKYFDETYTAQYKKEKKEFLDKALAGR